jgi:hypothetical protein
MKATLYLRLVLNFLKIGVYILELILKESLIISNGFSLTAEDRGEVSDDNTLYILLVFKNILALS